MFLLRALAFRAVIIAAVPLAAPPVIAQDFSALPPCKTGDTGKPYEMIVSCTVALAAKDASNKEKAEFYFLRGMWLMKTKRISAAAEDFESGVLLDPQHARLHRGRALVNQKFGEFDAAIPV